MKKTPDAEHLTNLLKLISPTPIPLNSENIHLLAQSLNNALNLCIKHIGKEPISKSPFPNTVCPKCYSKNIFIHRKAKPALYCPTCHKTYSNSATLRICPNCASGQGLIEVAASKTRYKCKECGITFAEGTGIPNGFNKFIHFSHLVYNTELSYKEIIEQLKISSDTYYRWKKRLAIIFPNTRTYLYNKRHKK